MCVCIYTHIDIDIDIDIKCMHACMHACIYVSCRRRLCTSPCSHPVVHSWFNPLHMHAPCISLFTPLCSHDTVRSMICVSPFPTGCPWSQQARQLTPRRGTVTHLEHQGCCVHIHTGNLSIHSMDACAPRVYLVHTRCAGVKSRHFSPSLYIYTYTYT